jgi:hypothetical protein
MRVLAIVVALCLVLASSVLAGTNTVITPPLGLRLGMPIDEALKIAFPSGTIPYREPVQVQGKPTIRLCDVAGSVIVVHRCFGFYNDKLAYVTFSFYDPNFNTFDVTFNSLVQSEDSAYDLSVVQKTVIGYVNFAGRSWPVVSYKDPQGNEARIQVAMPYFRIDKAWVWAELLR